MNSGGGAGAGGGAAPGSATRRARLEVDRAVTPSAAHDEDRRLMLDTPQPPPQSETALSDGRSLLATYRASRRKAALLTASKSGRRSPPSGEKNPPLLSTADHHHQQKGGKSVTLATPFSAPAQQSLFHGAATPLDATDEPKKNRLFADASDAPDEDNDDPAAHHTVELERLCTLASSISRRLKAVVTDSPTRGHHAKDRVHEDDGIRSTPSTVPRWSSSKDQVHEDDGTRSTPSTVPRWSSSSGPAAPSPRRDSPARATRASPAQRPRSAAKASPPRQRPGVAQISPEPPDANFFYPKPPKLHEARPPPTPAEAARADAGVIVELTRALATAATVRDETVSQLELENDALRSKVVDLQRNLQELALSFDALLVCLDQPPVIEDDFTSDLRLSAAHAVAHDAKRKNDAASSSFAGPKSH